MERNTCFVIMPISDPSDYVAGHFSIVYQHLIKPACERAGFVPLRADDVNETNCIALDVLQRIVDAEMAVCDISARNPNVLYELGLRHAVRRPVTIIKDSKTDDVFDIQGIRRIEYEHSLRVDSVKKKVDELAEAIRKTYEAGGESPNSLMALIERRGAVTVLPQTELDIPKLRVSE